VTLHQAEAGAGLAVQWARAKIDALLDARTAGAAADDVRLAVIDVALRLVADAHPRNNLFHISGTDIVRCLSFRFQAFGRPVKNSKKFEEGIFSSAKTNQTTTIKDVAQDSFNPAKLPKDMEAGLYATAVYKADVENFPNGVHICEVEVDPETGVVSVVKYNVVDDVGTVMNPLLLKGQIVGGVAMGVGQILKEDINFDADGQLTTGSFMDYAMPRAHDFCAIEVKANPVPTKTNPIGSKGAGEAGCVGAMPAVANALVNALSEFGVKHIEMPATPERVWRAIGNGKA